MTDSITFDIVDSIPDAEPLPIVSSDLTCEVCGTPLSYGGRGRKPRFCADHKPVRATSSGPRRSSSRDVDAAMSALTGSHTAVQFALMLVSPDAGAIFEVSRADLDIRNRAILESDPGLAKRIASMASKGGGGALIISHLIAIGPAAAIAMRQIKNAAQTRAQAQAQMQTDEPAFDF